MTKFFILDRLILALVLACIFSIFCKNYCYAANANSLAVEARQYWDNAQNENDLKRKLTILNKVLENLDRIVKEFPESNLAVDILGGREVAGLKYQDVVRNIQETRSEPALCFNSPTKECILDMATVDANNGSADDTLISYEAVLIIANERINIEKNTTKLLKQIANFNDKPTGWGPSLKEIALSAIIMKQIKNGNEEGALKIINEFRIGKDAGLSYLLQGQIESQNFPKALKTAQMFQSEDRRETALVDIAKSQVGSNGIQSAMQLLEEIKSEARKGAILVKIAGAYARNGKKEEAFQVVEKLKVGLTQNDF